MAVLRDIVAKFTVDVDDVPLTKMQKRVDGVIASMKSMALVAGTAASAAAYGAYQMVEAASDADEALNVLRETFKGNSDAVVEWSKTMSKELSRSEFTLQDSVGKFGSLLAPMFRGSSVDIATMSQDLAALSVDIASFKNLTDEQARDTIFSALAGETEAVRRIGVDITQAGLEDYMKSVGDKRAFASLTRQQKTLLIVKKMMLDTADAQGDAKRTADSWANSTKAVSEQLKSLAVRIGRALMPAAKRVLGFVSDLIGFLETVTLRTKTFEAAWIVLCSTGIAFSTAWAVVNRTKLLASFQSLAATLAGWLPVLAPIALAAAGIALAFLAVEDTLTTLSGGKSVLGDFLDIMFEIKKPAEFLKKMWDDVRESIADIIAHGAELTKVMHPLGWYQLATEGYNPRLSRNTADNDIQAVERRVAAETKAIQSNDLAAFTKVRKQSLGTTDLQDFNEFQAQRAQFLGSGKKVSNLSNKDLSLMDPAAIPVFRTSAGQAKGVVGDTIVTVNVDARGAKDPEAVAQKTAEAFKSATAQREADKEKRKTAARIGGQR